MNPLAVVIAIAALVVVRPDSAVAQSDPDGFELGVQIASAISSQFDEADVGLGGRFSWHPAGLVGIEAEINLYPGSFPDQRPFSRGRMEGLFGVTVGATFDRVRPFAKLRPGFMSFRGLTDYCPYLARPFGPCASIAIFHIAPRPTT